MFCKNIPTKYPLSVLVYIEEVEKIIHFDENMVNRYTKKIFGFAYNKTRNIHQAEDLAQEILCALVSALPKQTTIADMDGFVHKVASHTWCNFLRKNKRHWHNLDMSHLQTIQASQNVAAEAEQNVLLENMQAHIAYLTALHRRITLLFYYENKTSKEIATTLNIRHSTIRWHLTEIKKKLKAGIEMGTTTYEPKRLYAGHDGQCYDSSLCGLGHNPLADNIALVCYGRALTIETIARTLNVAAFYIEPLVQDMVRMDYMVAKGKNKYTTNFYICTANFAIEAAKYKLHHIQPYAEKILTVHRKYQDQIQAIGFVGSHLDPDFLLWAMLPLALQNLYYQSLGHVMAENNITMDPPLRSDGSRHWVTAGIQNDHYDINRFTPEEVDFKNKADGNGIKSSHYTSGLKSLQYDSYATIQAGCHWREFGSKADLHSIQRITHIIRTQETPNPHDQEIIAHFVAQGYVAVEDGKPKLLIPYLNAHEWQQYTNLWQHIHQEIGQNLFAPFIQGFAAVMEKEIPPFISPEERNHLKYQAYPQYSVLYWLADQGLLRTPTPEEARRLCTVVWQE